MGYVYDGNFEEYIGRQILVKYDNKQFQGEVVDIYVSYEKGANGVIIEDSEGNFKHIKARRLDEQPQIVA